MCFKFRLMLRRHDCRAGVEEASPSSFTSTMNKRQMCTFLLSGSKPSALQSRIMTITIHGNKLELPITITLLAACANGPFCFHVLYVALGHSRLFSKLVIRDDIITRTLRSLCCWLTGEEWFGFGSSLSGTFWPQPPLPTLDAEWGHFSLQTSSCAIIPQSPFGHRVIWHSDIPAERLQTYSRINTVYWKIHCGVRSGRPVESPPCQEKGILDLCLPLFVRPFGKILYGGHSLIRMPTKKVHSVGPGRIVLYISKSFISPESSQNRRFDLVYHNTLNTFNLYP